jgi:hypothetical protein
MLRESIGWGDYRETPDQISGETSTAPIEDFVAEATRPV